MLVASYEAIQFQRLDLFSVTLRQIGAYISRMQVADAIDVLCRMGGRERERRPRVHRGHRPHRRHGGGR